MSSSTQVASTGISSAVTGVTTSVTPVSPSTIPVNKANLGDITPPTAPSNLVATAVSGTQITLSWSASTDDVGVFGYRIYSNGVPIQRVTTTSYVLGSLSPSTSYKFEVLAYDASGNKSGLSSPATATTLEDGVNKFNKNDTAQVIEGPLNVRDIPSISGKILGSQSTGALGTVLESKPTKNIHNWWKIDFASGADGWVAGDYLVKYVSQIPLPTVSITAASTSIQYNTSTTISWSSTNATSCTISSGQSGLSGSFSTGNLATSTIYRAHCDGQGGSADGSATVIVSSQTPDQKLITDNRTILIPNAGTYPTKGAVTTDPVTSLNVTRVSDKSELLGDYNNYKSPQSLIVYSRYTPSNTTGEYVLVHGDNSTSAWIYRIADNKMMTILRFNPSLGQNSRSIGEVNELRWDYTGQHPYRLYFVGRSIPNSQGQGERVGMSFYYTDFNPANGTQSAPVLIRDFSSDFAAFPTGEIMNDVEGDSSNDSRYWAWQVMDTSRGQGYLPLAIFTYDKTANKIIGKLQRSCTNVTGPCVSINTPATTAPYITRPNMVEMSPLGTRVIVDFERPYAGSNEANIGTVADGPKAFIPDFTDPIRIGADATHSGWAWGLNGEELFVSQNNRNDWIEAVDIRNATTANCNLISGNSYACGTKIIGYADLDNSYSSGFHFGKIYDQTKRGYAYMNTYATDFKNWGKNQNLLVEVNDGTKRPSKFVRLGSTYNLYYDYRTEGSGALDFQANNIFTTGDWGIKDGRGDAVRVELPKNLFSRLP